MDKRNWNGKAVFVMDGSATPGKTIGMALERGAASKLALSLKRLKNTTMAVPVEIEELITALDYVLVGDPSSTNTHKAMRASLAAEEESFPFHRAYPDSPSDADFERDKENR